MRTLALLLLLTLSATAFAAEKDKVYKWVDKDGVVHYSSQPPTENATPAKLPPLQTYKGGTAPPNLQKFDKPAKGGAAGGGMAQVEVVTPAHDETFRSAERVVPVAVLVTPQLSEGQKLIYLLDGTPQSAPTTDTSFALVGVERGTHTVSVSVIGPGGDEVGSSTGVTFHMKPPTAGQGKAQPAPTPAPQPGAKPPPKP